MALIKNRVNVFNKNIEPNGQAFVRINGWTHPLHWLQIIAWTFYVLMCLISFTFIVPTLPNTQLRCIVLSIKVVICVVQFITHAIAVNINPADSNVIDKVEQSADRPTFDRTKHSHVIENQFCYICETTVGSKSKHCSLCNKCVQHFDHHCKWLNNCVGGKNYRWFISCVVSALIGSISVFINSLFLTIAYFSIDSWLYEQNSTLLFFNNNNDLNKCLQIVWIVVIITSLVLSSISVLLLTHLLGFHLFLNFMGLSTYEFVVQQRNGKSYIAGLLNGTQSNKLYSYIRQLQTCIGVNICTKRRVKPSTDPNIDAFIEAKLSEKKLIDSVVNTKESIDLKTRTENTNTDNSLKVQKDIELRNNEIIAKSDTKSLSPKKRVNQWPELLPRIVENNEISDKSVDNSGDEQTIEERDTFDEQNTIKSQIRSNGTEDQPIFKPLNQWFEENGRTSRLSFVSKSDSLSPERTYPIIPSKHLYIRYNTFNKNIFHRNDNKNKNQNQFNRKTIDSKNIKQLINK